MSTEGIQKCSQCGGEIPVGSAHCPACMLGKAMGDADSLGDLADETTSSLDLGPVTEGVGNRIGSYSLLEKLGEGGFGVVWAAEQKEPVKRRVALKIIKLGMDTKQVVARFEAERQALAMMDHPNIAKVLDAGSTETGRPYFVMELVKGIPMTKYFEQEGTEVTEELKLFVRVCQAIQHAHQKGIIHRDIKPSNILITLHDGVPVPKVIDFGIAKATQGELTDKTIYTQYSQFIGTPAYMSPEQAELSGLDIDTRTDVYSLGVLLYEILTQTTPFDSHELARSGLDAMRKIIREREPEKPSTRMSQTLSSSELEASKGVSAESVIRVRGDLDWIVMKCLEKDRTRRYETAMGLARDVERHLNDEPVTAVAPSLGYQFQKLYRRYRGALRAAAVVVVLLMVAVVFSSWQAYRALVANDIAETERKTAEEERDRANSAKEDAEAQRLAAEDSKEELRRELYISDMMRMGEVFRSGNSELMTQHLARHYPEDDKIDTEDLRGAEWYHWWQVGHQELLRVEGRILSMALAPNDKYLAAAMNDALGLLVVRIFDLRSGDFIAELPVVDSSNPEDTGATIAPLCFSADGKTLAVACYGAKIRSWSTETWAERDVFYDAQTEDESEDYTGFHFLGRNLLSFSRDGSLLFGIYQNRDIVVWDVDSGRVVKRIDSLVDWAERLIVGLFPAPDGQSLIAASNHRSGQNSGTQGMLHRISLTASMFEEIERIEAPGAFASLCLTPDGQHLAAGFRDGSVGRWNMARLAESPAITEIRPGYEIQELAYSHDGKTLAVAVDSPNQIILVDFITQRVVTEFSFLQKLYLGPSIGFSRLEDRTFFWMGGQGGFRMWDTRLMGGVTEIPESEFAMGFRPFADGRLAWRSVPVSDYKWRKRHRATMRASTVSVESDPKPIELYDPASLQSMGYWDGGRRLRAHGISANGRYLVGLTEGRALVLWETESTLPVAETQLANHPERSGNFGLNVSNDARYVVWSEQFVAAPDRHRVFLWDTKTERPTELEDCRRSYFSWFSPDARLLVSFQGDFSGGYYGVVRQTSDPLEILTRIRSRASPVAMSFFGDSQRAVLGWLRQGMLIDVEEVRLDHRMYRQWAGNQNTAVALSADERRLFTGGMDWRIRIRDVEDGIERSVLPRQGGIIKMLVADPQGRWLASKAGKDPVKIWWIADEEAVDQHPMFLRSRLTSLMQAGKNREALTLAQQLNSMESELSPGWWEEALIYGRLGNWNQFRILRRDLLIRRTEERTKEAQGKLALLCLLMPEDDDNAVVEAGVALVEKVLTGANRSRDLAAALAIGKVRLGLIEEAVKDLHRGRVAGESTEIDDYVTPLEALAVVMIAYHQGDAGKAKDAFLWAKQKRAEEVQRGVSGRWERWAMQIGILTDVLLPEVAGLFESRE